MKPVPNAFSDGYYGQGKGEECFILPKRMYFEVGFFDFKLIRTGTFIFSKEINTKDLTHEAPLKLIKESFIKEEQRNCVIRLDFDPSQNRNHNKSLKSFEIYRRKFLEYMFHKQLIVNIWDADSKMLFGNF